MLSPSVTFAGTIVLDWDASPDPSVTEYRVYQDGVKTATVPANAKTVTLPNVTNVAHSYYVTAANGWAESVPSNTVTLPGVPSAPAGLRFKITVTTVTTVEQ